jgi:shikimate dehydrogenase
VRRLAVLGHPVAHSRSPAMQNAALAELGLAGGWSYEAIDVAPEDFEARVRAMPGEGFVGANVTVPHKLAALALADEAASAAQAIGAANTLTFDSERIRADNTDAAGILGAIGQSTKGLGVLVMGAGGSARAAVWALLGDGAAVTIWNRTPQRATQLASELGAVSAAGPPNIEDFDIIVNATTVGMAASRGLQAPVLKNLPIDADCLSARHLVVDLAYGDGDTALMQIAKARGARAVDGLEVLVHQGAASLRIWTGEEPPIEAMRGATRVS